MLTAEAARNGDGTLSFDSERLSLVVMTYLFAQRPVHFCIVTALLTENKTSVLSISYQKFDESRTGSRAQTHLRRH